MAELSTHENLETILRPPGKIILGNLLDIEGDVPIHDTIGLCSFNYRFNSIFRETPHPFVQATGEVHVIQDDLENTYQRATS